MPMKNLLFVLLALGLLLPSGAWAQGCSVCTKTAAGLDAGSARGLNGGIIYLAAIPLLALATLGYMWWRRNRAES